MGRDAGITIVRFSYFGTSLQDVQITKHGFLVQISKHQAIFSVSEGLDFVLNPDLSRAYLTKHLGVKFTKIRQTEVAWR